MKRSNARAIHPPARFPVSLNQLLWMLVIGVVILLVEAFAPAVRMPLPGSMPGNESTSAKADPAELYATDPARREQAIQALAVSAHAGSSEAEASLVAFFQRDDYVSQHGLAVARAIAAAGTHSAYQALIQAFRSSPSQIRRNAAMTALEASGPEVAHLLVAALRDPDAGVRSTSAELLGFRHDQVAAGALLAATHDVEPAVREAATWAAGGDLALWSALVRVQELRATDPDARVRLAATRAQERILGNMARELGVAPEDVLAVSVAAANGVIYAATPDALYAASDGAQWRIAGNLPDRPTALAAGGSDGQVVYLGTFSSGPFRSDDGGKTWKHITTGLPAAERLFVTALALSTAADANAQHVRIEVSALLGTTELHRTPLGAFESVDGGNHWSQAAAGATDQSDPTL